jgi:hypothetical protein
MLFTLVWVLAGITAWCVASLALALLVGPLVRGAAERRDRREPVRPSTAMLAPAMQLQR